MTDSNQLSSPARLRARSQAADERANGQLSKEERRRLAAESWDLGWDCAQVEEYELSEANFLRVQTLYRDLSAGGEEARDPMNLVAASLNYIGLLYLGRDRRDESIDWFDQAIAIRRDLQRVNSDDRENQVYLGGALCNRGNAVAESDRGEASEFYQRSLDELQQPERTCECSYWDEARNTWWCEQVEALAAAIGDGTVAWVGSAPHFIDNAMAGLASVTSK